MPHENFNLNLVKLERLMSLMDEDALTKKDFEAKLEQVLKLMIEMQRRQGEAIAKMEQSYANMMSKMQDDHAMNYSELRKAVNEVFVKGKLDEMDMGQKKQFGGLKAEVLSLVSSKLKNADYLLGQKLKEADLKVASLKSLKGDPGPIPPKEEILEIVSPLINEIKDEIKKDLRARLIPLGRNRVLAGPSANAIQSIEFTASGETTTFRGIPTFRRITGVFATQAPFIYRSNTYSIGANSITFNSLVNPIQDGQEVTIFYVK